MTNPIPAFAAAFCEGVRKAAGEHATFLTFRTVGSGDDEGVSIDVYGQLTFRYTLNGRTGQYEICVHSAQVEHPDAIHPGWAEKDKDIVFSQDMLFAEDAFFAAVPRICEDRLDSAAVERFACCNSYRACSDAKKCVHADQAAYLGCLYRQNLRHGRIFYGENATPV